MRVRPRSRAAHFAARKGGCRCWRCSLPLCSSCTLVRKKAALGSGTGRPQLGSAETLSAPIVPAMHASRTATCSSAPTPKKADPTWKSAVASSKRSNAARMRVQEDKILSQIVTD